MSKPEKRSGFSQGIMQTSSTAKENVGTRRTLADGRVFYYAKAGASALSAGKMSQAAAVAAAVTNKTATAASIGDTMLTLTITSATYAEDYFKGGFLHINDATGEGYQYPIIASTAVAASTSITLTLGEPIQVALTASSEFTLVHSPFMATVETTTVESVYVGIPPVAVAANYYYWSQVKGPAICWETGTPAVGTMLTGSTSAGAVAAINSTLDIDQPIIGVQLGTVGVATEYKPVLLNLPF